MNNYDLPKLAAPALRALLSINVRNLLELANHTKKEISDLHGMGPSSIKKLDDALKEIGLNFINQ